MLYASLSVRASARPTSQAIPAGTGGATNYCLSEGANIVYSATVRRTPPASQASEPRPNGPFFPEHGLPELAQFTDGTSNSVMVGERLLGGFAPTVPVDVRDGNQGGTRRAWASFPLPKSPT